MAHPPMPETAFEIRTLQDIADLRRGLLNIPELDRRKVAGCVDWVVALATGQPGTEAPGRLSAYRKMLRALLAEQGRPWPPPRARRRNGAAVDQPVPKTAEGGGARLGALVAVACLGAASMIGGGAAARTPGPPVSSSPAFGADQPIIPATRRSRRSEGQRAA